jgi:hypothetical protein
MNSGAPDFGYESSDDLCTLVQQIQSQIAAAEIRNCGFFHEANIAAHETPGSVFALYRGDNALPVLSQYLCKDRSQVVSCAHRNENYRPDVFTSEIDQLCAIGILDSSWSEISQSLNERLNQLDEDAARKRFEPGTQDRTVWRQRSQPIINDIQKLQELLLGELDNWVAVQAKGQMWQTRMCPLISTPTENAITPSEVQQKLRQPALLGSMVQTARTKALELLRIFNVI